MRLAEFLFFLLFFGLCGRTFLRCNNVLLLECSSGHNWSRTFSSPLCHLSPQTALEDECKYTVMETSQWNREVLELFFISEICSSTSRWIVAV